MEQKKNKDEGIKKYTRRKKKNKDTRDFPSGPVAKTLCSGAHSLVRELSPTCHN